MAGQRDYQYTRNMKELFEENQSEWKSYYCREDFADAVEAVRKAPKDAKAFRKHDLDLICAARELNADELLNRPELLETIPTRKQMQENLLQYFYHMCVEAPQTSDYMERLVRRLAPDFRQDTVRTVILKKFVLGAGNGFRRFHTDSVLNWAKQRLNTEEEAALANMTAEKQLDKLVSKLDDSIFQQQSVELTPRDVLCLIAERIPKYKQDTTLEFQGLRLKSETEKKLDEELIRAGVLDAFKSADEKVIRLASVLRAENAEMELDPALAAEVEKDFRNQLKEIKRVSKKGKSGTGADLYKQAKKDALKAKKNAVREDMDTELLELCSDLAEGNFRVNGKTKVYLYYFAFMFGMKLSVGDEDYDPDRDLVKNLFQDFYCDNMRRLLSGDYSRSESAHSVEQEPTGEGVNYKNFAEVTYLYYLCRDDLNLCPGERIDAAEATISACIQKAKRDPVHTQKITGRTEVFRRRYLEELLNVEPKDLVQVITDQYEVIPTQNVPTARIMVASEENTAVELVEELMEDLDEEDQFSNVRMEDPDEEETYTEEPLWADDCFREARELLEQKFGTDESFQKILNALNDRVQLKNGRFSGAKRRRVLYLLRVFCQYSGPSMPLTLYYLRKYMGESGYVVSEAQVTEGIKILTDLGYPIKRADKDSYELEPQEDADEQLDELRRLLSSRGCEIGPKEESLLGNLIACRLRFNCRITRSELITLHFRYYMTLLWYTDDIRTFPEIFQDYISTIDPILEEARYQPLCEKNIFDMYVVTALYVYLVLHGKETA